MKRIAALLLALALALPLAACGGEAGETDSLNVTARISGMDPEATVMTVDGTEVSAEFFLYWVLALTNNYASLYGEELADSQGRIDWERESEDGATLREALMEEITNTVILYITIENLAESYGVTLSDSSEAALADSREEYIAQLGSQEAYEEALGTSGLTPALNERLSRDSMLLYEMQREACREGSRLYIDDDVLYQYEGITPDTILADHILLLTGEDEAENQAAYAQMEEILAQLDATDPADLSAMFFSLGNLYSEDTGRAYYPYGYPITRDSSYAQSFKDAAFALEENQCSGIVESEFGYHIVMRRPLREYVAADYISGMLTAAMDRAEVTYTDLYESFDPAAFQEEYLALQAREAEGTPETET